MKSSPGRSSRNSFWNTVKSHRDAVNEFPLLQGKKLQSACSLFHLQIMVDFKCLPKRRVIWFTILSIFFWIHFFPKTKTKPPPIKLMTGHFLKPSIPQAPNSCERRIICERPKKRMKTMWKRVTRNLSKINLSMMWSKKAVFNVYTHIFIHIYICYKFCRFAQSYRAHLLPPARNYEMTTIGVAKGGVTTSILNYHLCDGKPAHSFCSNISK